jgi:hypothetical protein
MLEIYYPFFLTLHNAKSINFEMYSINKNKKQKTTLFSLHSME